MASCSRSNHISAVGLVVRSCRDKGQAQFPPIRNLAQPALHSGAECTGILLQGLLSADLQF